MEEALKKLEQAEKARDRVVALNRDAADADEAVVLARRALKQAEEEDKKPKPHPALQFTPLNQTVTIMAALTMGGSRSSWRLIAGMSVAPLPYDTLPFYYIFSRITIVAVLALVTYLGIIWYGYQQALDSLPAAKKKDKIEEMLKKARRPERPDLWANPRSHPSQFLTTRHAPPRLFPFPLGKTRLDAAVKDELWWEGGNAPHVGHFNQIKMDKPGVDPNKTEAVVMQKIKKQQGIDEQLVKWKKRIRGVQTMCIVVIMYFVNVKVAAIGLAWLIYSTLSNEIENMLKPPPSMDKTYALLDKYIKADYNQRAPRVQPGVSLTGGMTYIYEPGATEPKPAAEIPITAVPPPVLLTSENGYYAGPGDELGMAM